MIWLLLAAGGAALFWNRDRVAEEAKAVVIENSDSWTKYDGLFQRYASQYCPMIGNEKGWHVLKAICLNESSLGEAKSVALGLREPNNISGSKSYDGKSWGLMQFTLPTARDLDPTATEAKLNNAEYSIKLGAQYFAKLVRYFKTSDPRFLEWVVKSYNQGPGNSLKQSRGEKTNQDPKWIVHVQEYWERFQRNLARVKG